MPRTKKKQEEIDVDDILDEIDEEEIEDADELDDDDDPTTETPKRKSGRSRAKASKKKATAKKEKTGVGTAELAEAAGVDPRTLRVLLRAEFPREEGGRYNWSSLNHPEAKKIIRRAKEGGAKEARDASLEKLKKSKGKSKKGKVSAAEAKKRRAAARRKKARAAADDDE